MRRRLVKSAVASGLAAGLVAAGLAVGTASAQAHGWQADDWTLNVVAMGDSYGSGTGAGDYQDGTGVANGCWRSANSYSENVVARLESFGLPVSFDNVTCSGATTAEVGEEYRGQPPQLDALQRDTHLVFLTVGTNDIDFDGWGLLCASGDCSGQPSEDEIAEMPAMGDNVAALLTEIRERSPWAKIVLAGYGSMVSAGENAPGVEHDALCDPGLFTLEERIDGNRVLSALDEELRHTARQARGVTYASPYQRDSQTLRSSFEGHSLCQAKEPYYRGLEALDPGQEGIEAVLHLNQQGHEALAKVVMRKLFRGWGR